jgi:hypothetical protein
MYNEDSSDEYEQEDSTRNESGLKKIGTVTTDDQEPQDLIQTGAGPSEQVVQEEAGEVPEEERVEEMRLGESADTAWRSRNPRRPPPPQWPPPAGLPRPQHLYHQRVNVEKSGQMAAWPSRNPRPPPPPPAELPRPQHVYQQGVDVGKSGQMAPPPPLSSTKPSLPLQPPSLFIGINEH